MKSKYEGYEGTKVGRLTLKDSFKVGHYLKYNCVCDCGKELSVYAHGLIGKNANAKSCGCLQREIARKNLTTHGQNSNGVISVEYKSWHGMTQRCLNPKDKNFCNYGGRGITVCDKWKTFEGFFEDMGYKPSKDYQIERLNNNLGYFKENCEWSTRSNQMANRRKPTSNTTGVVGVYLLKNKNRYSAEIVHNKKKHFLGNFDTLEEAKQARLEAEIKYFGRVIER